MNDPINAWLFLIPSLAFVLGMYALGNGISYGLENLGKQLALRDILDETLIEDAPDENV